MLVGGQIASICTVRYMFEKECFSLFFLPTKNITEHSREKDVSIFSNKTVPHPKKPKSTGPNVVPYSRFFLLKSKLDFESPKKLNLNSKLKLKNKYTIYTYCHYQCIQLKGSNYEYQSKRWKRVFFYLIYLT
jgi:hypothetical protein